MTCLIVYHRPVVYLPICSTDDSRILQEDLLQIEEWANKWMMIFNTDKCEVLQVTFSNPKPTNYFLCNNKLVMQSILEYYWTLS